MCFSLNRATSLVLLISVICSSECCSPPQNYSPVGLLGQTILAPNIIIGKVRKIQSNGDPFFVPYSACVSVLRVIKNATEIPETLCVGKFGGEELCLLHVEVNQSYVMFLNRDYTARYDDLHGAAHPAISAVISKVEDAICQGKDDCEPPTLSSKWKDSAVVKESKNLELNCSPKGTTPFVISWLWNDRNLGIKVLTTTTNKLQVRKVSSRWSGRFTCVVKSPAGEISRSTQVRVDPIPCGGHILVEKQDAPFGFSSLNFPNTYPRDKSCTWRVCPQKGYALKLRFTDFALVGDYDNVEISFECSENNTSRPILWGRFCRASLPENVISPCKESCVRITHYAQSSNTDDAYFSSSDEEVNFGFKAILQLTHQVTTEQNHKKMFCNYDYIVKGRVKVHGIVSILIEVMENYVPGTRIISKELRFFYRYPLTDQRGCPISIEQGKVYIFLGIDGDIFYKLADIYQENEIRHQWVMKWKKEDPLVTCRV